MSASAPRRVGFRVPNAFCRQRVETFATKEPQTVAWIDALPAGACYWDIGANIGIYGLEKHTTPVCVALDKQPGVVRLGPNIAGEPGALSQDRVGLYSPAMTLDGLVDLLGLPLKPTHIKIDTDGFDLAVLLGGRRTLDEAVSVIAEVDESMPEDAATIRALMEAHGFTRTGRHVSPLFPKSPVGMDHWARP
jgi:hypothetical protein